jgi:hypothetical protein
MGEEGSEGAAVEANEMDGAVLESIGEMGEYDDIVAVDLDDAGREAVPRNRRDSEREEIGCLGRRGSVGGTRRRQRGSICRCGRSRPSSDMFGGRCRLRRSSR